MSQLNLSGGHTDARARALTRTRTHVLFVRSCVRDRFLPTPPCASVFQEILLIALRSCQELLRAHRSEHQPRQRSDHNFTFTRQLLEKGIYPFFPSPPARKQRGRDGKKKKKSAYHFPFFFNPRCKHFFRRVSGSLSVSTS